MLIFSRPPWATFRSHIVFSSRSIALNEFKLSYYSNYITFSSKKSLNLKIACAYMLNINQSSQERDLLTNWLYSVHSRHFLHHDIRFREMINIQLSRNLNRLQIHSLYFRRKKSTPRAWLGEHMTHWKLDLATTRGLALEAIMLCQWKRQ